MFKSMALAGLVALVLVLPGCEKLDEQAGLSAAQIEAITEEASKLRTQSEALDDKIATAKKAIEALPLVGDERRAKLVAFVTKLETQKKMLETNLANAEQLLKSHEFGDAKSFANTLKAVGVGAQAAGSTGLAGPYSGLVYGGGSILVALAGFLETLRRKEKKHLENVVVAVESAKNGKGHINPDDIKMPVPTEARVRNIRMTKALADG